MGGHDFDCAAKQEEVQAAFRGFIDDHITACADQFDREERLPLSLVSQMAEAGLWCAELPVEYGSRGMDMMAYGLLTEEIGRGCTNVRNLVGVQGMVSQSILRWGSEEQKQRWLPKMAAGKTVAAFALTEPETGSDTRSIKTTAAASGSDYILDGRKKWISFGQIADLFLVFAQCEGKSVAFLVERDRSGLSIGPISGLLGFRASMLAELHFEGCRVPEENMLGKIGSGLSHVASYGLTHGRYSTSWGCVGLAQGCLEATLRYVNVRQQFGAYLKQHELIQGMIADMVTNIKAARLLCWHVGYLQDTADVRALAEVAIAKYFASTMALKVATDAVQIHGANGCGSEYPVQRYWRDAKVAEIVEGASQIQQVMIAKNAFMGLL